MSDLLENKLLEFIESEQLFTKEDSLLLGVSGGVDSIVLLSLLHKLGFKTAVAHCNFQLRGGEAEKDAELVKKITTSLNIPFFLELFDTKTYAADKNISIQMAARNLRYEWFNKLSTDNDFRYILTAHHRDDLTETILLNQVRGTGLKGFAGILPISENRVRPLLFASKKEILQYAKSHNIRYREDSSNQHDVYKRNLLRNQVIPVLEKINPSLTEAFYKNANRSRRAFNIYKKEIQKQKEKCTNIKNNELWISIPRLLDLEEYPMYLHEWLRPYGFRYSQLNELLKILKLQSGKKISSEHFTLYKDRHYLLVVPIEEKKEGIDPVKVSEDVQTIKHGNLNLHLHRLDTESAAVSTDKIATDLDFNQLKYPLIIRYWESGDYFYPAGFGKRKKISDYLTDLKLPLPDKKSVRVLESEGKIALVIGQRADERFVVKKNSKYVLRVHVGYLSSPTSSSP